MLCDEGPEGQAENEFLQGLPPLSSSTSEASTIASTPRHHARCGLRGDRVGEAAHPGPTFAPLTWCSRDRCEQLCH